MSSGGLWRRSASRWSAASPAAIAVAALALVLAAGGAGYSAALIGTKDIRNGAVTGAKIKSNAVTSPKIKNGTVTNTDLVKEQRFVKFSAPGAPDFANGGQGDCVWQSAATTIPGVGDPSYRVDRSGVVHLAGIAIGGNGPGGDATCDYSGQVEDGVVTILPQRLRPATIQVRPVGAAGNGVIIVGNTTISGIPAGAVFWQGSPSFGVLLDGISYVPAGSPLAARTAARAAPRTHLGPQGRALLRHLLLR